MGKEEAKRWIGRSMVIGEAGVSLRQGVHF
jgi:hypothetical protein